MSEINTSVATDAKTVVESDNLTPEAFAARRIAALTPKEPEKEPEDKAGEAQSNDKEPEADSPESEPDAPVPESVDTGALSQVDLSKLTDEEIVALAAKGKSGLLKRVAELTAKRKQAEERAAALEQRFQQQSPVFTEAKVDNNPYAAIKTPAELNTKYQEVSDVIEWAEGVLDQSDHLVGGDIAADVAGKQMTKSEVKETLRNARKAKEKLIPAQFKELQEENGRMQQGIAFANQARKELPWLDDKDSEPMKILAAMLNDPRTSKLEKAAPELAPQLGYLLAHAVNSMHSRKALPLTEPVKDAKPGAIKVSPPSNPSTAAAGSDRRETRGEQDVKVASQRVRESGKVVDFIALRTAQIAKRKSI